MDIFCIACQKKVGHITDEKIPIGKKMSVRCPDCGEKIVFIRPVDFSSEYNLDENGAAVNDGILEGEPVQNQSHPLSDDDLPATTFGIMAIIGEARARIAGAKGPVWGAIALFFLANMLFVATTNFFSRIIGPGSVAAALGVATQLTVSVAMYPFMAGIMLIGIRRSIDLPIDYKVAFSCFGYILPLVIASFLVSLLSGLGFILLIIPGVYLTVAYLLVIPLIIDKKMGPWQAMEASRKAIHRQWFKVLGLYVLMTCICLISAIPLGLGLIWTVPMFIMAGAILYRETFGVSEAA